jgi:hypothetical protein
MPSKFANSSVILSAAKNLAHLFGHPMHAMRWLILVVAFALAQRSAAATLTLASAAMGPTGQAIGPSVSVTNYVGWRFRVNSTTAVTEVGGHLGAISGNLFAAIISLTALDAMPQGAPFADGTVKASTSFTPPSPSEEFRTPLSASLAPGSYALIFGSGRFNASGTAMAAINGQANIAPTTQASYVFWRQTLPNVFNWTVGTSNNIRFVVVGSEIAGPTDFNIDGKVDSNDVLVWKAGYGGTAPAGIANGDANADGKVDGADFLAWQRSLPTPTTSTPAASAVPEPSSSALIVCAVLFAGRIFSIGCRTTLSRGVVRF